MKFCKRYYTAKILVYVSLWTFLITGHSYEALADNPSGDGLRIIPNEEMPVFLDLIGNRIRDNYERIITWSGEIDVKINWLWTGAKAEEFSEKLTGTKGQMLAAILQKAEERTTFAIDAGKNFVYVDNFREKRCKFLDPVSGADVGIMSWPHSSGPTGYTIIGRPNFLLKSTPQSLDRKENKIIRRKAFKRPSPRKESRTGLYEGIISDPRRIFMPGAIPTWDNHNILIKKINRYGKIEFDGYSLQMEERIRGDVIEYKIIEPSVVSLERSDPNHYVIIAEIFSSQCGFNMTYLEAATGNGMVFQKFTWEYESINGVYLPKRVVKKHYNSNGDVTSEKDYTFINNKLNQKIPSETFEYTNLKLKDGDIFIDEILKKEYRYKVSTQTLEPIEK